MAKPDPKISGQRRIAVVTARGGKPEEVTVKDYEEKYLEHEEEVVTNYPDLDLSRIRDKRVWKPEEADKDNVKPVVTAPEGGAPTENPKSAERE